MRTKRKLAAILHADVAGYSRLMGRDEAGTHAQLKACREIFRDIAAGYGGRIVGTAGDAILADFPSVVEALSAALDGQSRLTERNAGLVAGDRLEFRIGINLGDVIVDEDDILGDGVNVAARVQSLAEPGGIAVSGAVHEQVKAKLGLDFRDLGEQRVKNIAEPIRVYAVAGAAAAPALPKRRIRFVAFLAGGGLALAAAAVAVWQGGLLAPSPAEPPPAEEAADTGATLDARPTIAVLPFENRSNDPDQQYFSDGVTEDVIADLGRFSSLTVLSWNAVAPYRGEATPLDVLSRDLGVRYVVGGSLRRDGDQLRVTVQLTDAERGALLWSERYDRALDDVFAVQEAISQEVVGALAIRLTRVENERAAQRPTDELAAYDLVLRGRDLVRRVEPEPTYQARRLFERAVAQDPGYADAYVGLGFSHLQDFLFGWAEWPDRSMANAEEMARTAIDLDEGNEDAHALLAAALTFQWEFDRAEVEIDRALELNSNSALILAIQGTLLVRSGRPDEALQSLERALRLDPHPFSWWLAGTGAAYYLLGRHDETVSVLTRYSRDLDEDPVIYAVLAAAYTQLGDRDLAAAAVERLQSISPFFNGRVVASSYADPAHQQMLMDGFAAAGLD